MARPPGPKTPTSEILAAIDAVKELKDVVEKHSQLIEKLASRLEKLEAQAGAGEGVSGQPPS